MDPVDIRRARFQRPFRSFYLRAKDGRRFPVIEPEHVAISTRLLIVVDPSDNLPTHVTPNQIDAIEYVDEQSENSGHGHRRDS
jgi:hypothetical protein